MRNLKRALSLTLASVMLLGMMVFGTSAASFTDADQISNVTAATVLQELKVMQGSNGKFSPNQTVTRGQMAILICKMLYGDKLSADNFAGTSLFDDCPDNAYYTGYVNLAAQLGIISGYGNGKFGPGSPVTTAQAALMLTRALGYFQAGELEGQSWANNAIAAMERATKINMFGNLKLGTNEPLSRDNVAEMVFNTMTKAVPVHYSERWDVYYTDSQSILNGVNFNYRDTLAYQNFDLVYNEDKTDDFERPATEWGTGVINSIDDKGNIAKNGANIKVSFIKAVNDADETYTAKVKMSDICKDLGLGETVPVGKIDTYRNGKSVTSEELSKSNDTKIGGNGVLTQVWYDADDKTATISMIDTYVGKVSTVNKATGSAERSVTISQFQSHSVPNLGAALNTKFETESFAAKDVVLYTAAWNGKKYDIKTMEALGAPVTGTLTKWNGTSVSVDTGKSESSFTVDNNTYKYDVNAVVSDENDSQVEGVWSQFTVNESEVNVYTDKYGYAIYVSGIEGEKSYAAVIGVGNTNPYGDETTGVTLLLPDGTKKSVTAKLKTGSTFSDDGGNPAKNLVTDLIGDLVSYKIKDNVYELTVLDNYNTTNVDYKDNGVNTDASYFTNGKSAITLGGTSYYVTNDTIFFVATMSGSDVVYNVYTGYDAMPNFGADASTKLTAYALKTRNEYTTQLEAVYIAANALGGTSTVDTYFVKKSGAEIITDSTGSYYVLPAIVNGEVTEIKLDATSTIAGIDWSKNKDAKTVGVFAIKNVTRDKNDIITNFANASAAFNATNSGSKTGTVATARGVLGIGTTVAGNTVYWAYNNSTKAYIVNEDLDEIAAIDVSNIGTDTNDLVYAKADNDTKVLQDVIVREVKTPTGGGDSGNSGNAGNQTEDIATVPAGAEVSVTVKDNLATITISGDEVNPTVPADKKAEMSTLFGNSFVDAATGGILKPGHAIITVDVLANAPTAAYYQIVQTNPALSSVYPGGGGGISGNVKTKTYSYADLIDGLSLILMDGKDATLVITPVTDSTGDTPITGMSAIVIKIDNNATFLCSAGAETADDVSDALADTSVHEVIVNRDMTISEAISKDMTVSAGVTVTLDNSATISGNVTVESGATLKVGGDRSAATNKIKLEGGAIEVTAAGTKLPALASGSTGTLKLPANTNVMAIIPTQASAVTGGYATEVVGVAGQTVKAASGGVMITGDGKFNGDVTQGINQYSQGKDRYIYAFKLPVSGSAIVADGYAEGTNVVVSYLDGAGNKVCADGGSNVTGAANTIFRQISTDVETVIVKYKVTESENAVEKTLTFTLK